MNCLKVLTGRLVCNRGLVVPIILLSSAWAPNASAGPVGKTRDAIAAAEAGLPSERLFIRSMQLMAPSAGWVLAQQHLLWTDDGGRNWKDVTPAAEAIQGLEAAHFLTRSVGWVLLRSTPGGDGVVPPLAFARTDKGGESWTITRFPLTLGDADDYAGHAGVFFLNRQHGWVTVRLASSANLSRGALYGTADGGENWVRLPDPPVAGSVVFRSTREGWLAGGPADDELYVTHDGGSSWHRVRPELGGPLQSSITYRLPFFSDNRGLVAATVRDDEGKAAVALYRTNDGGESWQLDRSVSLLAKVGAGVRQPTAYIGSEVVVADSATGGVGFVRLDETGSASFTTSKTLPEDGYVAHLSFADRNSGWILVFSRKCLGFKKDCQEETRLFATHDGGATWSEITPPPKLAPAAKTEAAPRRWLRLSRERGFDRAAAPDLGTLRSWWQDPNCPYKFLNLYYGGGTGDGRSDNRYLPTREHNDRTITAEYVRQVTETEMGWGILPTWVGRQAPTADSKDDFWLMSLNENEAEQQGMAEGEGAARRAQNLGLLPGEVIYYDLEPYARGDQSANRFVRGWVRMLHRLGYKAGVYGHRRNVPEWWALPEPDRPDAVWVVSLVPDENTHPASVFGVPGLDDNYWSRQQRILQYYFDAQDYCGSIPLRIDRDLADGPVSEVWSVKRAFSVPPTITLALGDAAKQQYRIGDTIRLKMTTTAGVPAPSGSGTPKVSIFLWVDAPNGRRFLAESQGRLVETPTPSPVWKPVAPVDYSWELLSTTVSPSSVAGTYTWNAAMYTSESMSEATLVARSTPVSYRIVLERGPQPSVTSVRTSLNLYRVGDTMVIYYSTLRGAGTGNYDLMLRIASKDCPDYYFYDDRSDTNRWIHQTPRPMWTGVPQDGNFHIPSGDMPAIVIEDDTPSGDYTMTAYFSEPGKNTPVGNSAQTQFRLETPTAGCCFIATAAWGSPMASSVRLLRSFRERYLLPSRWGRGMVRVYQRIGPRAAAAIQPHEALRKAVRIVLWPVVAFAAVALRLNLWLALCAAALVVAGFVFAMRRAPNRVRLAILVLALVAAAQAADVQGTVVRARPFPIPIPGARIELVETGQAVASDQDGGFRFLKLAGGEYTLKASSPGYLASSLKVSVPASTSVVKVVVPLNPIGERVYEYYLPHTAEGGGWWTFFNVLNPGNTSADLTMAAHDAEGNYLGASAKISRLKINQQLSGAPSEYFAAEVISKAAWYKLTSTVPLTGFEVFGSEQGTLAGFPLPTADSSQLYLPHVAQDDQWWTGVSFVSAGTRLSEFHLEARDRTGRLLAEAGWPKYLGPGEKTVDVINNYFGWDFPAEIQWASVRSDSPITGFELFGTRDFKMMAAVPALTKGWKKFYFPHVATTDGWWTGIAMLNVDTRAGTLRMTAYGEDGKALASSRSLSLGAGERAVGTAESFFDNWPKGVKYLEASSDVGVVGFELVGRSAPPLFGGLPALSAPGSELVYSHVIATSSWETSIGILSTSGTTSQVSLQAFDAEGNRLAQVKLSLPPRGYRFGSLASLFSRVPSGTSWVKATSDGAPLVGFFKLARISDGQFTEIPAEPLLSANANLAGLALQLAAEHPGIARLAQAAHLEPVAGIGLRVTWTSDIDAEVRALVADSVQRGDIIIAVEGQPVKTRSDLWGAYLKWGTHDSVSVLLRSAGGVRTVKIRNPLLRREPARETPGSSSAPGFFYHKSP